MGSKGLSRSICGSRAFLSIRSVGPRLVYSEVTINSIPRWYTRDGLSDTISFKVAAKVKEKMRRLSSDIDWPDELREYVSRRITQVEREKMVVKADQLLEGVRQARKGTSSKLVREDRESH